MYTMLVCCDSAGHRQTIHLVNDQGSVAYRAPDVPSALRWLVHRGEDQVVAMTDAGPELFLIEPCGCPTMTLPALSLRRAHHGGCLDLPKLPGLSTGPAARARAAELSASNDNGRRR